LGNRFLPAKLASLRFSSRNDKDPGCEWGGRKWALRAHFRPPHLLPMPCLLERAKRLRGLSNGIYFSALHKHVIGSSKSPKKWPQSLMTEKAKQFNLKGNIHISFSSAIFAALAAEYRSAAMFLLFTRYA